MFKISKEYMDKIETVKNHFGIKAQESYIWNELEELREAAEKYGNARKIKNDLTEERKNLVSEIADCYFMSIQIERKDMVQEFIIYFICDLLFPNQFIEFFKEVIEEMYFKIDRTIDRIKTGYYECTRVGTFHALPHAHGGAPGVPCCGWRVHATENGIQPFNGYAHGGSHAFHLNFYCAFYGNYRVHRHSMGHAHVSP